MGMYRITIVATGGHGVDREKGSGAVVDFLADGDRSPDAIAKLLVEELKSAGNQVSEATITHWPGSPSQVLDDLLTGKRAGSF